MLRTARGEVDALGIDVAAQVGVCGIGVGAVAQGHPHGLPDTQFDTVFTRDKPVIFAYHGYPMLIHRLTYRRTNHANVHVRGFTEEGTTTTPFDMVMLNDLDRFHLVIDVIDRVPGLGTKAAHLRQAMVDARQECRDYTRAHGEDHPRGHGWAGRSCGVPARPPRFVNS